MKNTTTFLITFTIIILFLASSCKKDQQDSPTIWSGTMITFEKNNGSDPIQAANQDRLNNDVWITRGNMGGQIFNAVIENDSDKNESPKGTLWALGTTADLPNLTFKKFRAAVGNPKQVVGKKLVLLLEDENIAIDLIFTSWAENQGGGFAYERSSN